MKLTRESQQLPTIVLATASICTLAINPWYALDPINIVKQSALFIGSCLALAFLFLNIRQNLVRAKSVLVLVLLWILGLLVSYVINLEGKSLEQTTWGTWGRSTGTLTFFAFATILFSSAFLDSRTTGHQITKWFERTSYIVASYSIIQYAELDPINWSQQDTFATLGNINFMSGFLGLAISMFLSKVILQDLPAATKAFFLVVSAIYSALIINSGSLQGIIISMVGILVAITFRIYLKSSFRQAVVFSLTSFCGLVAGGLGVLGIGPLGSSLVQQTMLYRTDYWRAALHMFTDNYLFGVGQDSYGDFYRQYRDLTAVTRTGPNRITNTAHNVFLDLAAGSGIVGLLPFLIICVVILVGYSRNLRLNLEKNANLMIFFPVWISFIVYCMVSINQIGVTVWGFLLTGYLIGNIQSSPEQGNFSKASAKSKSERKNVSEPQKEHLTKKEFSKSGLKNWIFKTVALLSGIAISIPSNYADSGFFRATKANDKAMMKKYAFAMGSQEAHREFLASKYIESSDYAGVYGIAREALEINPRSYFFNIAIIESRGIATHSEVRIAAAQLRAIDPLNLELERRIKEILKEIDDD